MLILAAGSYLSQIMLLAGMILLVWILVRRNLRMRSKRRLVDRQLESQEISASRSVRGAPLADAPTEVLRWQASMFDLQRDLKAELETKILVVQSLIRQADARIAMLSRLELGQSSSASVSAELDSELDSESASPNAELFKNFGQVQRWFSRGLSADEIAEKLGIPLAEVELSLGCLKPVALTPVSSVTQGVTSLAND